jgi:hypothetical protein
MKSNVERMTEDLKKALFSNVYSFEIETKDIVFGFNKVLKKRTKSMAKAIALEQKLRNDVGRYLSSTVVVASVRMYKNGELRGEFKANNF